MFKPAPSPSAGYYHYGYVTETEDCSFAFKEVCEVGLESKLTGGAVGGWCFSASTGSLSLEEIMPKHTSLSAEEGMEEFEGKPNIA